MKAANFCTFSWCRSNGIMSSTKQSSTSVASKNGSPKKSFRNCPTLLRKFRYWCVEASFWIWRHQLCPRWNLHPLVEILGWFIAVFVLKYIFCIDHYSLKAVIKTFLFCFCIQKFFENFHFLAGFYFENLLIYNFFQFEGKFPPWIHHWALKSAC